jgi:hypothetical protein
MEVQGMGKYYKLNLKNEGVEGGREEDPFFEAV